MDENVKERDVFQDLLTVESSVNNYNQQKENQREIISTQYYSKIELKMKDNRSVTLSNVFITKERSVEGEITYHFRWIVEKETGEKAIDENIVVDKNGNIHMSDAFKEQFGDIDQIDIEGLMNENGSIKGGRLQGETRTKDEREKGKGQDEADKKDGQEQEIEHDEETQAIEQQLEEQGEDLRISKYRKIKDPYIGKRMPEVFGDAEEHGIAFSNKLQRYVIISKVNGQYQINENADPARLTYKSMISIDADGKEVGRERPYALMKIPNDNKKEIAVTLDNYGAPDIKTVDVLPCQERVARSVQMENELPNSETGQESLEVRNQIDKEGGRYYIHHIAHKQKMLEEYGVTETGLEELEELDIEAYIEEEADRVKMSKEGFKGYVKNASGKTLKEKVDNAQEEIVNEYMGRPSRPR